jgi:ERCC4-type nuclease
MKIIVDTREQLPLDFQHHYITEVIRRKLEVGDYGCQLEDGHETPIYFERKSVSDLFGTLSSGYKRFKKEILRAKENKLLLIIIIECSLTRIIKGIDESQRTGDEVVQQLFTIMCRYQVPFICCKDRFEMSRYITEFYLAYGREYIDRKKHCQTLEFTTDTHS